MINDPADTNSGSTRPAAEHRAVLIDADGVARMLGCSARHVRRMADAGRMPGSVKLGGLTRWEVAAVERWVQVGCPRMNGKRKS